MEKHLRMERKASDNEYFHRDFHKTLDLGLKYIGENFGEEAVKEYLTKFTKAYYGPLIQQIKQEGLTPLSIYFENNYRSEHAIDNCIICLTDNELNIEIKECPVLKFFSSVGYKHSKWFKETTNTVNRVIAQETNLIYIAGDYDDETGHDSFCFKLKRGNI